MVKSKNLYDRKWIIVAFVILIALIYFLFKRFLCNEMISDSLTKKLMNYISNDGKNNFKMSSYDTIGNEKGGDRSHKNFNKNHFDSAIQIDSSNNDSLSAFVEKETNERNQKLLRFAEDYCRASPNINLNQKSLLNIGWRTAKFNYQVDYEIVNFKGEKTNVYFINLDKFNHDRNSYK
jgi:hypothetical protein